MAKKVIVVDDSRSARRMVANALNGAGFLAIEAVDGQDGLVKVAANRDAVLVICDLNMPRMGGLEMRTFVHRGITPVPFLMLTTEQPSESLRKTGPEGWILKPFRVEDLVAQVQKLARDTAVAVAR